MLLSPNHAIADIGSGTGFLSELFLKNGNASSASSPTRTCARPAKNISPPTTRFTSIDGSAEATTLDDSSVDFVTAGQAFHWFEPEATRREFSRILKPAWLGRRRLE